MSTAGAGTAGWRDASEGEVRLAVVGKVAYLDGSVGSYRQKKAIGKVTASLPRVSRVVNRLRVVPCTPRPDAAIRSDVEAALAEHPELRGWGLSISVSDGVVELRGVLPSPGACTAAEAIAWSVCGVQHVVNRLAVAGPERPQQREEVPLDLGRDIA